MNLIKDRRSVRKYKDKIVEQAVVEKIIDLARFAPSWGNTQVARYTIINDENLIKKIAKDCVQGFVYNVKVLENAKNVAIISYVEGKSGAFDKEKAQALGLGDGGYVTDKGADWEIFDAGIATQTFCLSAFENGIGTCIMGVFDAKKVADVISLPYDETVAAIVTFGYPAETPAPTPRMEVDKLVRFI